MIGREVVSWVFKVPAAERNVVPEGLARLSTVDGRAQKGSRCTHDVNETTAFPQLGNEQ